MTLDNKAFLSLCVSVSARVFAVIVSGTSHSVRLVNMN